MATVIIRSEKLLWMRIEKIPLNLEGNYISEIFARASITKYRKLSGLNNRNILSHNSGA